MVIPAGQSSAKFNAHLPYDRIADGSSFIRVTAESPGLLPVTGGLVVGDTEMFAIQLINNDPHNIQPIYESAGTVMARVDRFGIVTGQPLRLLVTSSDPSIAYVDPVVIEAPANQRYFEFPIVIVDDRLFESPQSVRLTFTPQNSPAEPVTFDLTVEDEESSWHNLASPLDVNGDGQVTPLDALLVINYINRYGGLPLANLPKPEPADFSYVDTSRDQMLTALDALLVINYINSNPAGEGAPIYDEGAPMYDETLRVKGLAKLFELSRRP